MEQSHKHNSVGRSVVGAGLILFGALILMHNLDIVYIDHVSRYWPALFILFGAARLLGSDDDPRQGHGLGWIFFGSWLLVSINGMWGLDFGNSWPILIVGWGISLLWRALYPQPRLVATEEHPHGN